MEPTGIEPVTSCLQLGGRRNRWSPLGSNGRTYWAGAVQRRSLVAVVFRSYLVPTWSQYRFRSPPNTSREVFSGWAWIVVRRSLQRSLLAPDAATASIWPDEEGLVPQALEAPEPSVNVTVVPATGSPPESSTLTRFPRRLHRHSRPPPSRGLPRRSTAELRALRCQPPATRSPCSAFLRRSRPTAAPATPWTAPSLTARGCSTSPQSRHRAGPHRYRRGAATSSRRPSSTQERRRSRSWHDRGRGVAGRWPCAWRSGSVACMDDRPASRWEGLANLRAATDADRLSCSRDTSGVHRHASDFE